MPRSHYERMRRRITGSSEPPPLPEVLGVLDTPFPSDSPPNAGGTVPPNPVPKIDPGANGEAFRNQRHFGMTFFLELLDADGPDETLRVAREGVARGGDLGIPLSDWHAISVKCRTIADALISACGEVQSKEDGSW